MPLPRLPSPTHLADAGNASHAMRQRLLLKDSTVLSSAEGQGANPAGGGAKYKCLMNLLMQLRKCCDHPYLFAGAEDDPDETSLEELVGASGKLRVLDRLLLKLHAKGHRVVLFSQFSSMVDLLDDCDQTPPLEPTSLTNRHSSPGTPPLCSSADPALASHRALPWQTAGCAASTSCVSRARPTECNAWSTCRPSTRPTPRSFSSS